MTVYITPIFPNRRPAERKRSVGNLEENNFVNNIFDLINGSNHERELNPHLAKTLPYLFIKYLLIYIT